MHHPLERGVAALCVFAGPTLAQCEIVRLDPNGPVNVGEGATLLDELVVFPVALDAVTLFHHEAMDGWHEGKTLHPGGGGIFYPMRTAAADGAIVASFPDGDGGVGRVSVYERGTAWDVETELDPGDQVFGDVFGASVAAAQETIVVGATMDLFMSGAYGPGKGYVFERRAGAWKLAARVVPNGYTDTLTRFGGACDTDGQTAIFGAPDDDEAGPGTGAAYVYERGPNGWVEAAKLFAATPSTVDGFAEVVAVEADRLLVGAPTAAPGGLVHVFERVGGAWTATQVLGGSDSVPGDRFGGAIDLAGDRLVVGAPAADGHDLDTGKVYVFARAGGAWAEEAGLTADDVPGGYRFGSRVSLWGNQLLVGPGLGPEVRLYSLGLEDVTSYCSASANSTGAPALLGATGCDSVLADELTLRAAPVPAGQFGIFLFARKPAQTPFGNGLLCLAAPLHRGPITTTDAGGAMTAQLALGKGPGIFSGSTWHFQAFFRDPGVGVGFDSSDGVRLVFRP